jgi:hypothetical protein
MVSMFQNVSQNRSEENRKIILKDIRYAYCSAYMSAYLGTYSIFSNSKGYHLYGYAPHGWIYYMKGVGNDVRCCWRVQFESVNGTGTTPSKITAGAASGAENRSFIRIATGETKNPAAVYPGLSISDGEVKIIVEVGSYFNRGHANCRYLDGSVAASLREVFGFFLIDPIITAYEANSGGNIYFNSIIIFTPKSGLFDGIAPTE